MVLETAFGLCQYSVSIVDADSKYSSQKAALTTVSEIFSFIFMPDMSARNELNSDAMAESTNWSGENSKHISVF